MRATLRWLACTVSLALLLLYVHDHYRPDNAVTGFLPHTSVLDRLKLSLPTDADAEQPAEPLVVAEPLTTIEQFWQKWSIVIYDARPQTSSIQLIGSASTLPPNNKDEARRPYNDLLTTTRADVKSMQEQHALFVKELDKINNDTDMFSGQGVVMVGGGEYFGPAIISIHMLRRSGSTLPVEVFIPNKDEYETELCEQYLPRLNARCIVLSTILAQGSSPSDRLDASHYQFKSLALLLSSFQEVLLLDSDSIPLSNPSTSLFDIPPYSTEGLVIWPDFWLSTESPDFWSIAGVAAFPDTLPATASEAGQLLVNKSTHLASLLLATYYNIFGPSHYYPLLSQGALGQGDKETFMAAAVVLNQTYYRVKTPVVAVGRHDGNEQRGTAMVQYLPSDDLANTQSTSTGPPAVRPAFLHSNTPKMNAGHLIDEGDLFTHDGAKRLRLLGSKDDQVKLFGLDLEKTIWELLVQTGCELADVVGEWRGRDRMCERLEEHYTAVFGEAESSKKSSWWGSRS